MKSWHYIVPVIILASLWAMSEHEDKQKDHAIVPESAAKVVRFASAAAVPSQAALPQLQTVQRVGGISVQDDLKTVYEIKGKPLGTEQPSDQNRERVFIYEDCRIGLYDQFVRYVSVPVTAGEVELDGHRVKMSLDELRRVLGEPHAIVEDGWVYRYGQSALKLMLEDQADRLTYIHYFHVGAM